jgi:hypothetical protein
VADSVDLGRDLRGRELDEHLAAAVRIGAELGLGSEALTERLQKLVENEDEKEQ